MKQCTGCSEPKALDEFDIRSDTGKPRSQCKSCRRESQRRRLLCSNPPAPRSKRIVGARETFICTRCLRALPADAFPRKGKGSLFLQSWCRECFSEFNRGNYAANKQRDIARARKNQRIAIEKSRPLLREYLATHPCVDCAETDIGVLEFDHLRDKSADVSRLVSSGLSWERIMAEIEKCEVRCANCHRRITRQRREAAKLQRADAIATRDTWTLVSTQAAVGA